LTWKFLKATLGLFIFWETVIFQRSSLLTLLLLASIGFAITKTYLLWKAGPWDIPQSGRGKPFIITEAKKPAPRMQLVNTRDIIEKNLFDPERGASRTKEAEASSLAMQKVRSLVLMGTAVLGASRYAIFQEPLDPRAVGPRPQGGNMNTLRLKVGDQVEGFRLSEVQDKRVVFSKGPLKVELTLDYFRKMEGVPDRSIAPAPVPVPGRPGVIPRIPRRETPENPG